MTRCHVCFRHCELSEGSIGFCGARIGLSGKVASANYGRITSIALDPIEKKPPLMPPLCLRVWNCSRRPVMSL